MDYFRLGKILVRIQGKADGRRQACRTETDKDIRYGQREAT